MDALFVANSDNDDDDGHDRIVESLIFQLLHFTIGSWLI